MCGAVKVFGLLLAAAQLKLPVRPVGVLALAENMIGPNAMRPGDVATTYNGLQVDIKNTDAEGRLVLADAIAYAGQLTADNQLPHYIIDIATLTGAVVKALGYELSGMMTQDNTLSTALTRLSARAAVMKSGRYRWTNVLPGRSAAPLPTYLIRQPTTQLSVRPQPIS